VRCSYSVRNVMAFKIIISVTSEELILPQDVHFSSILHSQIFSNISEQQLLTDL
jgi:hypothetical protein